MRPTPITAAFVVAVAVAAAGCGGGAGGGTTEGGAPGGRAPGVAARVTGVNDGDTIRVEVDGRRERVRMVGIDTPEVSGPYTAAECFGPEASARTKALLRTGDAVRLVRDPAQPERDRFDRLLAYVYADGASVPVNERLVADGYAEVFRARPHFSLYARYMDLQRRAQDAGRGRWGACGR